MTPGEFFNPHFDNELDQLAANWSQKMSTNSSKKLSQKKEQLLQTLRQAPLQSRKEALAYLESRLTSPSQAKPQKS
jgi:hypothetical protein